MNCAAALQSVVISLCCCVVSPMVLRTWAGATVEYHVATDGHDRWSGKLAKPNDSETDGPFASLRGARDAIRKLKSIGKGLPGPVTVHVHAGEYNLDHPFVLEPQDSGTPEEPIVYTAYRGDRPIFSGGRTVTGFRQNGPLWEAVIPDVKQHGWYFRQLFVDGSRRQRARGPNVGYYRIARLLPGPPDAKGRRIARDRFVFSPGNIRVWQQLSDVNLVLMHSWETSIHPLKSVDLDTSIVQFVAPLKEWWGIGHWEKNQRYYVENARELLDQPGEWYLDRETGRLTYWPLPGEDLSKTRVVAPRLTELVRFAGDSDRGTLVKCVTLRELAFHYSDWVLDPKGNSSTQAAVEVPASIMADGASQCVIQRCEVAHVGSYGIWFRRGCKDCRIQQNRLFDLGAGGIRVGEANMAKTDQSETSRTLVDNNHVFDGGRVYAAGIGIWVAQSSHNQISHNDIHDLFYSGISIGWNWGLKPNRTHHNIIEYNHVHDLVHGVLSDAGLIYALGVSPGSIIRNNVFHDIWPYSHPPFGWGIYLDAHCGNYLVENNIVYNTRSGGMMFNNGGHEHTIRNNIFALSADYALWPYSEERPSTFRRNIVYLTQGKLLVPYGERSLKQRLAAKQPLGDWDQNIYWDTQDANRLRFYGRDFLQWQELGLYQHSQIADPKFRNVAEHDFRLRSDSPALKLGFKPIQTGSVGLYGDPVWANEVTHSQCPNTPLPPPTPPPAPLEVNDGFEKTPVGRGPDHAHVSGEEQGGSIRVTNQRARTGKQSLKITDSERLHPSWQPHFYYEPHFREGRVRLSFDCWLDNAAQFIAEWRDKKAYPKNLGPSVQFGPGGKVTVAGKLLVTMPLRTWLHVEMVTLVGKQSEEHFTMTLQVADQPVKKFENLPIRGESFDAVHWLGFISSASVDTSFYLDNVRIQRVGKP